MKSKSEILQKKVRWNFEIAITVFGIFFTAIATFFLLDDMFSILDEKTENGYIVSSIEQIVFIFIVLMLIYGNIVYQLSRVGFLKRDKDFQRSKEEKVNIESEIFHKTNAPRLTILVPSYKEERKIIYQTLMSSALQEYPDKRVVLLIDNPPFPESQEDIATLSEARRIPQEIMDFLSPQRDFIEFQRSSFLRNIESDSFDIFVET